MIRTTMTTAGSKVGMSLSSIIQSFRARGESSVAVSRRGTNGRMNLLTNIRSFGNIRLAGRSGGTRSWSRSHTGLFTGCSVLAGIPSDHGRRGRSGLRGCSGWLGFTNLPCTHIGHFRILDFTILDFSLARLFLLGNTIGPDDDGKISHSEHIEVVKVVTYTEDPTGLNSGAEAFKGVAERCGVPGFPTASADV
jgi:hypothetical protein